MPVEVTPSLRTHGRQTDASCTPTEGDQRNGRPTARSSRTTRYPPAQTGRIYRPIGAAELAGGLQPRARPGREIQAMAAASLAGWGAR